MGVKYMLRNKPKKISYKERTNFYNASNWNLNDEEDFSDRTDDLATIEED